MEIEAAIKQQKPFVNNKQKVSVNLIYTYGWLMSRSKNFFKPYGLTPQQYNILRILRGAGKPITTSLIRERMLDRMSDTTRMIDRMIIKGFVRKSSCSTDRRLVDISITEEGLSLLKVLDGRSGEMENMMCKLSEEEADLLSNLLDKMRG